MCCAHAQQRRRASGQEYVGVDGQPATRVRHEAHEVVLALGLRRREHGVRPHVAHEHLREKLDEAAQPGHLARGLVPLAAGGRGTRAGAGARPGLGLEWG